ncbi:MAG TPA: hypothetical protein VFF30_05755 [Nitrososphaerales archaeon]|nr:hypothetical protein [Nitrososphaerales archaeon]
MRGRQIHRVFRDQGGILNRAWGADYFKSLVKVFRSGKTEYARMMALEMGRLIARAFS